MLSRRLLKRCWTHITTLRHRSAISGTANQPREILGGDVCDMPAAADFSLIPAPRGLPILGTTLALMKAGSSPQLHRYVDARHAELGPVYRESIGPVDAVFVCDPVEMRRVFQREGRYPKHLLPDAWILYNQLHGCKRGLFFMDGEEWLNNRRVMNRLMLKGTNLDSLLAPSSLVASHLVSRWKQEQEKLTGPLDVEDLDRQMYRWSLDVIVGTLLGSELYERHAPELDSRLASLAENIIHVFEDSAKLALLPARLARVLHLPSWTRFECNVDRALQEASSLVLDLLPMARGGDGLLEGMLESGLELRDIVRIIVDLVLAAGDTTSYAAQWTLYLLARHPEQQHLVSQQVHKDTPTALVRGVIRESLRLYPVAPFITRVLPEDCELGGYNIPAGKLVIMSLFTSGRSAVDFPDPERFWPERWLRSENSADHGSYRGVINQHATVPFALGARSCIGRKLAETQLMDIVVKLLREFRLELQEPQREVQPVMQLVTVPSEPIKLRLVPR